MQADIKQAMRDRDKAKLETLRLAMNELKNAGIDKKGRAGQAGGADAPAADAAPVDLLDEPEVVQVLQKLLKRRREAAKQFQEGGREELAQRELAEAELLDGYLPQGLSDAELETLVKEAIAETGASSMKEMGAVMKALMAKAAGRADGATVSSAVRKLLS